MSSFSRFTPLINSLPTTIPFIGPEAIERSRGLKVKARIGANENGFGPSPKAIAAMEQAARETWQYADPENYDLRVALAAHLAVTANHINVGGGIDGLLGLIVRMIVLPGTPVVTSLGGYPTFNFQVAGFGGRLVTVPYKDDHEDLEGLLDAVKRENAPLVYVANPDNPMGSWHTAEEIVTFAKALPETALLILDEAYGETAPAGSIPSIESLINLPNVIRTRTFSKAYGMAGSRVGYAISTPENANAFDKIRNHFGMNRIAIAAAMAALADKDYLEATLTRIKSARDRIADIARANQLSPLPSATNFVAIDTGRDGPYSRAIVDGLMEEGVFIRLPGVAPLNRCIRVSVGPEADLALFEEALPKVLRRLE